MKKDNRGLTLVELLVAVTMLAVVISPFLNTFVASARQNNKARETMRATTVAQNLMEGLEAFSLEEICTRINSAESGAGSMFYLPNGYEKHKEVSNAAGEKSGTIENGSYVFKSTPSNTYVFGIQGMEEDGRKYDARILIDASEYETGVTQSNDMEIHLMNETTDAIFPVSTSDDNTALTSKNWQLSDVERTFNITLKKNASDSEKTDVSIKVVYKKGSNSVDGKSLNLTYDTLEYIYLMYYPNYASISSKVLDKFVVNYQIDKECNLCIVKQKYDTAKTDHTYAVSLNVTDSNSDGKQRLTLRTNMQDNLYNDGTGSTLNYSYNGNTGVDDAGVFLGFWNGKSQSVAGQTHQSNTIYKTTVQIFPEGTYEANKFETEQPLAQLGN